MIASTATVAQTPMLSNPALYIGMALGLLAGYVGLGVFSSRVPLPKLPSERRAEHFSSGLDSLIADGMSLYGHRVASAEDFAMWQTSHRIWIERAFDWLSQNVSEGRAHEFAIPFPTNAEVSGSYNEKHREERLTLHWRINFLRKLEEAGP